MDASKRNRLIEKLSAQPDPQVVPIAQFFDGNDDCASIGCNLIEHPGIDTFQTILVGLAESPNVEAVYAQISELDPGKDCWPFADTIFVAGQISADELREILSPLEPDHVGPAADYGVPDVVCARHTAPILAAWWD